MAEQKQPSVYRRNQVYPPREQAAVADAQASIPLENASNNISPLVASGLPVAPAATLLQLEEVVPGSEEGYLYPEGGYGWVVTGGEGRLV